MLTSLRIKDEVCYIYWFLFSVTQDLFILVLGGASILFFLSMVVKLPHIFVRLVQEIFYAAFLLPGDLSIQIIGKH